MAVQKYVDLFIISAIAVARWVLRLIKGSPLNKLFKIGNPNAMFVAHQYNCWCRLLTAYNVTGIGYDSTINLGYCPEGKYKEGKVDGLFEEYDLSTRMQLQHYHNIIGDVKVAGQDVLEIGSGRGGGSSFVASKLGPKSMTGVDLASDEVAHCREQYSEIKNLKYVVGNSQDLPKDWTDKFDVVINCESSHCYPNFMAFAKEAFRVCKKGGYMCYADIMPPDMAKGAQWAFSKGAGFEIVRNQDVTKDALRSLDAMSGPRKIALQKFPWVVRSMLANFTGQPGSLTHDRLTSGEWCYILLTMRKPE